MSNFYYKTETENPDFPKPKTRFLTAAPGFANPNYNGPWVNGNMVGDAR